MANEVKIPVGFDTDPAKRDLEQAKSFIGQFSGTIKADLERSFTSVGQRAGQATSDYLKNVVRDIGYSLAQQSESFRSALAGYEARGRLGGMMRGIPGAEFAAGTPEGAAMMRKIADQLRPIAEQEAKGAREIGNITGENTAALALGEAILSEIKKLVMGLLGFGNVGSPPGPRR